MLATPWIAAEVAVRGAEVVRQTGVLERVARVLEAQVTPYSATRSGPQRPPVAGAAGAGAVVETAGVTTAAAEARIGGGQGAEPGEELADPEVRVDPDASELRAAAILRVANDFEDLRTAEPGPGANARALARIRRGVGGLYDPHAVEALARLFAAQ